MSMSMKAPGRFGEDADLSFKGSPVGIGAMLHGGIASTRMNNVDLMFNSKNGDHQSGSAEHIEQMKAKEEEIKILWNVIKEINKSKGSEKVSMEQLQQVITSSRGPTTMLQSPPM